VNITNLAIQNSRITILSIILATLIGLSTYLSYPSSEDPSIVIRNAVVSAQYPGMAAERIENLITEPLENALRSIAEIDEIKSTSRIGSTRIDVSIHDWVEDLDPVFQDIRNKVDDAKSELPADTYPPSVNDDYGLTAIATVALWSDGFSLAEMRVVARDLRKKLYTLDGVKRIEFYGIQDERIYLEMDPGKLSNLGISPREIFAELVHQNVIKPSGTIHVNGKALVLEPSGDFDTVKDISNVVFAIPGGRQIARLGDIVNVKRGYADPPQSPVFYNGKAAIVLSISTVEGTNNVEFGKELKATVAKLQNDLPIGLVLDFASFQPDLIETAVQGAVSNVYQTLAIVLLVVMVFLGLRTGLIVGFFVPLTMLTGIIVMRLLEIELQRMSIAAMIIALGLLVDNGIVIAEDIRVRLEKGVEKVKAASGAGGTLAVPLLVSSLTTICAFLPMLMLEGGAGDYVRSLSQVVAILLLVSWVLSMTITPAMSVWFMKISSAQSSETKPYTGVIYQLYRKALFAILRARTIFIIVLVVLLVGSLKILTYVPTEFFPLGERDQFLIYIDFEAGTDVQEVQAKLSATTRWLADPEKNPEIANHIAYIGGGGPRFFLSLSPVEADPHKAFILVNTKRSDQVSDVISRTNEFLLSNMPEARADAKKMWFGSTEPGQVEIRIIGPDSDILAKTSEQVMDAFHSVPGTTGIKHDWENKVPKLIVDIDQAKARRAGVTTSDIAEALNVTFSGTALSDYRERDQSIPIVLRANEDIRTSLHGLQQVRISSSSQNQSLLLSQVATIKAKWQFGKIKRRDQQRTLTVEARNPYISSTKLVEAMQPTLNNLNLPAGYRWEIGGEVADQAEANGKLFAILPLALAAIIVLIVGQFNSFRRGAIVIATIPLMMIGGVLGLVIMGAPYGFMVLLGFFSLAGILINNGIVLIDRIEIERAEGKEPLDAIWAACHARFRPILMTMLTTVLGLIPLILFGGALFYGMASVIAFGLIVATVITLGFVPVMYTLLFKVQTDKTTLQKQFNSWD